ncbi:MAG: DNA cytosine methyltransferase [Pseudanabaena sp. M151S2SP2A07QC]|nr:DNA cytosine methyltransferase [Pseudanabaena sp. M151S2SP2A07QC]
MLNGLDLFSGYGGISLALSRWVRPRYYGESDKYAQGILLSRMSDGVLPVAPIWEDVRTLKGEFLEIKPDIIYGGFPCQDISVAGLRKGLAGERSGLFYEIVRLTQEIRPSFVFLENVPAIRTRGLLEVIRALTDLRYDCRWTRVSAESVGAPHLRERWFLLAYSHSERLRIGRQWSEERKTEADTQSQHDGEKESLAYTDSLWKLSKQDSRQFSFNGTSDSSPLCDSHSKRLERQRKESSGASEKFKDFSDSSWWSVEPNVGRVANGTPFRVDRLKALGNGVVPIQAMTAFQRLIGLDKGV